MRVFVGLLGRGFVIHVHTFQQFASPLLLRLDDHPEEIVARPKRGVFHLLRHQFLHRPPQFFVFLEVGSYGGGLLLDVEFVLPFFVFPAFGVLREALGGGMYSVQLSVEACTVDDSLAVFVFAFEEDLFRPVCIGFFGRWGDGNGFFEKIPNVGAEFEDGGVGCFFGFFEVLETFCGFGAES